MRRGAIPTACVLVACAVLLARAVDVVVGAPPLGSARARAAARYGHAPQQQLQHPTQIECGARLRDEQLCTREYLQSDDVAEKRDEPVSLHEQEQMDQPRKTTDVSIQFLQRVHDEEFRCA